MYVEADSVVQSKGLFKSYFVLNAGSSSLKYCEQKLSIVDASAAAFSNLLPCEKHSPVSVTAIISSF